MERCWLCLLQRQLVQHIRLDGRTEIRITAQQQHLNTPLPCALQHGIERRPAAGVDIGEGIVEEHWQHAVVSGAKDLGHGQAHGSSQELSRSAAEILERPSNAGIPLPIEIGKALAGIKPQANP